MVHLWIHLLICANHEEREEYFAGKPITCKPGQFTTGRNQLVESTGINRSKVERILNKLDKFEHQIEQQTSNTNRLITILNWDEYQSIEHQSEQQVSNDRATSEQQVSTLQEVKNKRTKEIKNYKRTLLSEIVISDFPELNNDYLEIAKSFQELFKSNLLEAGSPTKIIDNAKGTWIDDIRLMIESDGAAIENIRAIFKFLKVDTFWKQNILSTSKLREQYPKLILKIHNGNEQSKQKTKPSMRMVHYKMYGHFYTHAEFAYLRNINIEGKENIEFLNYVD